MGMFDWVYVNKNWLYDDEPEDGWQTKSLDNRLDFYEITEDGRLLKSDSFITNPEYWSDCYTGNVTFYNNIASWRELDWREYTAEFKNGKLIKITKNE